MIQKPYVNLNNCKTMSKLRQALRTLAKGTSKEEAVTELTSYSVTDATLASAADHIPVKPAKQSTPDYERAARLVAETQTAIAKQSKDSH